MERPANGAHWVLRGVLPLWHEYRIPIICFSLAIFALLRLVPLARDAPARTALSPSLGSPASSSKEIKRSDWPREEEPLAAASKGFDNDHVEEVTVAKTPARPSTGPKRVTGSKTPKGQSRQDRSPIPRPEQIRPLVFFSSLSGATEKAASQLVTDLAQSLSSFEPSRFRLLPPQLHDLSYIDHDTYFVTPPKSETPTSYFYMILLPTYNVDTQVDNFLSHLQETHHDFRIDTAPLSSLLGYSVFGFGDLEGWPSEEEGFCSQAREVDKWMAKLTGRKRAYPLGIGDVKGDAQERLIGWRKGLETVLRDLAQGKGLGEGVPGSGAAVESDEEDLDEAEAEESRRARLDDLEDLGGLVQRDARDQPLTVDFTSYSKKARVPPTAHAPKEMVPKSSPTYAALTKQGYSIVGSHSGVKLCRWTKSALRGRGSCYKFSFYGIASHQCMETTPSLSCSNKCVFCWRHGTNPVGTTWRWQVDPPELIFKGAKEGHVRKIKTMRGVPGVRAERFEEALRIRHCALSLVGEPIFYPHINEFTAMLHAERISTFLVCNAQHPEQLRALKPVTQLYVSIDASNKESLRKIDRPLHRDYWDRFTACLDILREKRFRQRTVFRLTLVKGFNIEDEMLGYAELVQRALPCFVEVKGVTYCGTSSAAGAGLTMANVPFHDEVRAFVTALEAELRKRGLAYGLAAEHAHSCCALIASERFRLRGQWHTLIDYAKFFDRLEAGADFAPEDYIGAPTPHWALWGKGGFDPRDVRVDRKGKRKDGLVVVVDPEVPAS